MNCPLITSLGNLSLTTLTVKNFFLISHLNPPSFSLRPLPLLKAMVFQNKSIKRFYPEITKRNLSEHTSLPSSYPLYFGQMTQEITSHLLMVLSLSIILLHSTNFSARHAALCSASMHFLKLLLQVFSVIFY